jgi:hypothetical protein
MNCSLKICVQKPTSTRSTSSFYLRQTKPQTWLLSQPQPQLQLQLQPKVPKQSSPPTELLSNPSHTSTLPPHIFQIHTSPPYTNPTTSPPLPHRPLTSAYPAPSTTPATTPPSDYIFGTLAFLASLAALYLAYRQLRLRRRPQIYEMPGAYEMTRGL